MRKPIQKKVKLEGLRLLVPHKVEIPLKELRIVKKIEKPHVCRNCGKPFKRSYPRTHDKFLFCSQSCHNQWKKKRAILRKQRIEQEKAQEKTVFSFCMWCGHRISLREKRKFCCSECGRDYKQIEQRITNTFENPQVELKRLEKLGCSYSFPEQHQNLNGLYGLPIPRIANGLS